MAKLEVTFAINYSRTPIIEEIIGFRDKNELPAFRRDGQDFYLFYKSIVVPDLWMCIPCASAGYLSSVLTHSHWPTSINTPVISWSFLGSRS